MGLTLYYEAHFCYYKDDISSNSQAGQQNTGTCCYGQLIRVFQKNAILSASSPYTIVFLSVDTMQAPTFITTVFPKYLASSQAAFLQEHM